jgi:hypothetical protein
MNNKDTLKQALLTLLSATHPGEVMAAREAVLRIAKRQGMDMHKLADRVAPSRRATIDGIPEEILHPPTERWEDAAKAMSLAEDALYKHKRYPYLSDKDKAWLECLADKPWRALSHAQWNRLYRFRDRSWEAEKTAAYDRKKAAEARMPPQGGVSQL